ncbi:MAG: ABC transporter permease [Phycisphaerales bacterium JB063]
MLKQFFAISRNTFLEAIRQPIFVVLILVGALAMVINPFLAAYTMDPGEGDNRMLIDLGLGTLFLAGMFLAAFTATGVVASEMESRTALTVVSKPVPRPVFVVGKFLGVAGAITVALYILAIVLLFTIRHKVLQNASDHLDGPVLTFSLLALFGALAIAAAANYLYRRVFTSMFTGLLAVLLTLAYAVVLMVSPEWSFQSPIHDLAEHDYQIVEIMIASFLIGQGVLVLTAIAVAFSTRFSQVATLLACLVILVLGLGAGAISQLINQRLGIDAQAGTLQSLSPILSSSEPLLQKTLYLAGKALYVVTPNFQFHWPSDAVSLESSLIHDENGNFSTSYIRDVSLYTFAYITALLALGVILFQKREVS